MSRKVSEDAGASVPWAALFDLARRQANVVTVAQAIALGIDPGTLRRRASREGWPRPFPKVAVLPGTLLDGATLAVAAALSVGPDSVITGRTALAIHGVADRWPHRVEIAIPAERVRAARDGVRLRRTRTLQPADVGLHRGVRLATVPRAFLDACPLTSRDVLRAWLIDGRQRRRLQVPEVAARVISEPHAPGRRRLLQACVDVDASGADSVFVHHVEELLSRAGIAFDTPPRTVPTPHRELHPDITLAGYRIAIEVDGFGSHASRTSLERDQRKHNAYVLAGWIVLRIGWDRFTRDPHGFVAEVRAAMAQASTAAGTS